MRPAALIVLAAIAPLAAPAQTTDSQTPRSGVWESMQAQLYGSRAIGLVDETYMHVEAPASTPDPTATPLTVQFGPQAIGHISRLRVIIDNNPSPLVAVIDLAPGARVAELGLRVRIDRLTSARVIAETREGALEMRSTWINASGGCSAPSSAAGAGAVGDVRFHATPDGRAVQIGVRHPNHSGFQIDPVSGDPIAPYFIRHVRVSAAGAAWLEADLGISISENPTLRIGSDVAVPTPLTVEFTDSKEAQYAARWPADPHAPAPGAHG